MSSMQHAFHAGTAAITTAFTFSMNLRGPKLSAGIEIDTAALKPGIYLTSDESERAWVRYLVLDYRNPPCIKEGKIFNAVLNELGHLVSQSSADSSLLRIRVYDPMIRRINNGDLEIRHINGSPDKKELVWKKSLKSGGTVGFDAIYELKNGDVIVVFYPGGLQFLACQKGKIIQLDGEDNIVKKWNAQRQQDLVYDQIAKAQELAEAFPRHPQSASWNDEITRFAAGDESVKSAFLETLFDTICIQLKDAVVDEEGFWSRMDVFKMHTLYEITSHASKEYLSLARASLRDAAALVHADLPLPIIEKFGMEWKSKPEVLSVKSDPASAEKRRRRAANLAERAKNNRDRAHGGGSSKK
jgi:hypothetical protein